MKKQIASLVTFALLLSGCSAEVITPNSNTSSAPQEAVAMGRYVEKNISPDFSQQNYISAIFINATDDGKLVLHSRGNNCRTHIYENDNWQEKQYSDKELLKPVTQKYYGSDELSKTSDTNARPYISEHITTGTEALGPDGYTFTAGWYLYTEDDKYNGTPIENKFKQEYFYVSYNGTDARYYNIPELSNKTNDTIKSPMYYSRISRQNILILSSREENAFYDIASEGGKKLGTVPNKPNEFEDNFPYTSVVGVIDNTVLITNKNNVNLHSLSTGEITATVELKDVQLVCEGFDGAFYALNKEGIWRILPEGGILQRVIDGSTCSFSAPAFRASAFIQDKNGSFYVTGTNNSAGVVYKYEFSQNTPLEREITLHLWSLRDNPTIRETAAEFMRQNPEVKVYIEIVPKDTELKKATENLISALLAGTGPDLIITDGIDLAKLDAQSVLAPISTEVDLLQYDKRLLPYGQLNNRQIAVGTKLFCTQNSRNDVSQKLTGPFNIEELLNEAKAEKQTIEKLRQAAGKEYMINPLLAYSSFDDALNAVYTAASAEIWKNDFNKAAAETVLQLMAEINTKFIYSKSDPYVSPKKRLFVITGTSYNNDTHIAGLYGKANVTLTRMIAYSANTQNEDLCVAFINTMLSDYIQTAKTSDALPVTQTVKLTDIDIDYKEITQNVFALDCLVRQNSGEVLQLSADAIQVITENYARDDGFKAIALDYINGKIDLETALAKAEKLQ